MKIEWPSRQSNELKRYLKRGPVYRSSFQGGTVFTCVPDRNVARTETTVLTFSVFIGSDWFGAWEEKSRFRSGFLFEVNLQTSRGQC